MTRPDIWEAAEAERERYILFMLGNDEAARVFWEEWLPSLLKENPAEAGQEEANMTPEQERQRVEYLRLQCRKVALEEMLEYINDLLAGHPGKDLGQYARTPEGFGGGTSIPRVTPETAGDYCTGTGLGTGR